MAHRHGHRSRISLVSEVLPGDVLRYTIVFQNTSTQDVAAGSVVITNPLPEQTLYVEGSAAGARTEVTFSVDGETFAEHPKRCVVGGSAAGSARAADAADYRAIRWTYQPRPAGCRRVRRKSVSSC